MEKLVLLFLAVFGLSMAQAEPVVGRDAAAGYMGQNSSRSTSSSGNHYLALHIGKLVSADSWKWGKQEKQKDIGSTTFGLTYRFDQWYTTDLSIRVDFNEYNIDGKRPQKLSFMPVITFPEAASQFPLYFGMGAGLGVFFKQLSAESSLSFDYQLIVGIRFFDVFENTGFFLESGLKNHLQLTDDGQVNAAYIATGALFTF